MRAALPRDVSRPRQVWMVLLVAALILLPTIARSYQTITKAQTPRLGYRSAWLGVAAPRAATASPKMSVIVRAPIAAAIEAPTFSGRFPMHAVDETIPFPPRYRAFDILRGPPSTFLD